MSYASERMKVWRAANPDKAYNLHLRNYLMKNYGITVEEFQRMVDVQGNRCAICTRHLTDLVRTDSRGRFYGRLYVDEDATKSRIRALLCKDCNIGLGMFKEEPMLLEMAKVYLQCA